jgi:hypothetical protein
MADIVARWRDWSGEGLEHLVLGEGGAGVTAVSVVIGADEGTPFAARYRIACDTLWRVRELEVELLGEPFGISVTADGEGGWFDVAGNRLGHLDGAIDVDLSATPFTNTLPIRRLDLAPHATADILTAYVAFPALTLEPNPQRYTCLERRRRYRFESLVIDFSRDIETDAAGLVTLYPDLFRRVL